MKSITINFSTNKIELSESFAKKAGTVGSVEYRMLVNVKKEHPECSIEIIKSKRTSKGIDTNFMRNYIISHDESATLLYDFEKLVTYKASYLEIKAWFIDKYPAFKNYKTKTEWILAA